MAKSERDAASTRAQGAEETCDGTCDSCGATTPCETDQEREYRLQQSRLERTAAAIKHKILVLSGKGGVGKSTVAATLAWALALRDYRVGLLDADLHGPTIALMMGLRGQQATGTGDGLLPVPVAANLSVMSMGLLMAEETAPVIWRGPIRANAIRQLIADVEWGELDFLVVDLPPGTGDEPLTAAQSFPDADGAVVVTTPQEASLYDCRKAIRFVRAVELPVLGVIENMSGFVCPHCGEETRIFSQGGGETMAAQMGVPFLGRVPLAPEVVGLGDQGEPLLGPLAPASVRDSFGAVVEALLAEIGDSGRAR